MSLKFPTIPGKRLAETINGSALSFKLSDIEGWDGADLTSASFGSELYVVFRNSANTLMELMKVDPTTITAASSPITITLRGLKFDGDLTTEVSANKLTWVKGDTIVELGSNPPQLFQWLKEYIDNIAVAGAPDASTSTKGIVQEATAAQIRSRIAAGSTLARLFINPSTIPNVLTSDYVADTGSADAYAIAPSPAITAYTTGQVFSFKATNANTGTSTVNVNGLGAKTIKLADGSTNLSSGNIAAGQVVVVEYDGTNFQLLSGIANAVTPKFGGTGSDGALSISSGTTSIDLGGARVVVKNYTSISITGTGSLAFTNPHANGTVVIIKSQGNITLTSSATPMIDASGLGASGGTGVSGGTGATVAGNNGTSGLGVFIQTNAGAGAGTAGAVPSFAFTSTSLPTTSHLGKYPFVFCGAGGGSGGIANAGGSPSSTTGNGGRGGGALIIECGGAWNFTTANGISVAGKNGGGGWDSGGSNPSRAGSGGGGGGYFICMYKTLTANTGSVVTSGGTGSGGNNQGGSTAGGGGGGLTAGTAGAGGGGTGGNGGTGFSLVTQNAEFV